MESNYLIETVTHINALISGGMKPEEVMELMNKMPLPYEATPLIHHVPVWLFIEGATNIADLLHRGPEIITKEAFKGVV